jgi:hypothetical protein
MMGWSGVLLNWSRSRLSRVELDFLRGFERRSEILLRGQSTVQLFHGSPRSHMENMLASTRQPSLLAGMLVDGDGNRMTPHRTLRWSKPDSNSRSHPDWRARLARHDVDT